MKAPEPVPVGAEGLDEQSLAAMSVADAAALTARPGNLWRDTARSILRQRG